MTAPFYAVRDSSEDIAVLVNLLFLAAIILATYHNRQEDRFSKVFQRPFELHQEAPLWTAKVLSHNYPPRRMPWPFRKSLTTIAAHNDSIEKRRRIRLVFGSALSGFNLQFAQYYALLLRLEDSSFPTYRILPGRLYSAPAGIADLLDEDYVLTKTGRSGQRSQGLAGFEANLARILEHFPDHFMEISQMRLPDNTEAVIYYRTGFSIRESISVIRADTVTRRELDERLNWFREVDDLMPLGNRLRVRAYAELGRRYLRFGDLGKATLAYQGGLTLEPTDKGLQNGLRGTCRKWEEKLGQDSEKLGIDTSKVFVERCRGVLGLQRSAED